MWLRDRVNKEFLYWSKVNWLVSDNQRYTMHGSQMITREINGTILGMFEPPTKSYKTVKPIQIGDSHYLYPLARESRVIFQNQKAERGSQDSFLRLLNLQRIQANIKESMRYMHYATAALFLCSCLDLTIFGHAWEAFQTALEVPKVSLP